MNALKGDSVSEIQEALKALNHFFQSGTKEHFRMLYQFNFLSVTKRLLTPHTDPESLYTLVQMINNIGLILLHFEGSSSAIVLYSTFFISFSTHYYHILFLHSVIFFFFLFSFSHNSYY